MCVDICCRYMMMYVDTKKTRDMRLGGLDQGQVQGSFWIRGTCWNEKPKKDWG